MVVTNNDVETVILLLRSIEKALLLIEQYEREKRKDESDDRIRVYRADNSEPGTDFTL
tara:strand:- start:2649 stop:2822 length:174 start_codon:yes stop_codon:yes gene_type:complete